MGRVPVSTRFRRAGGAPGDYGVPVDRGRAQEWCDRYVAAWLSYDPAAVADLFSEDVTEYYLRQP